MKHGEIVSTAEECHEDFNCRNCIERIRGSRQLVLFIVFFALLLDNMLMTVIVPVIPDFIFSKEHPDLYEKEKNRMNVNLPPTEIPTSLPVVTSTTTHAPSASPFPRLNGSDLTEYSNKTILLQHLIAIYEDRLEKQNQRQEDFTKTSAPTEEIEKTEESIRKLGIIQDLRVQLGHVIRQENVKVGILFGSKAFVQLLTNPFVGMITNRFGYSLPMFTGFIIMFASTLVFAIGSSYPVLLIARMLQGVGSSCSSVAGMGMLAHRYHNDDERGAAVGFALSGLAFGVLIGPPFGGVMYEFFGKSAPFYVLSMLAFLEGMLQLLILNPSVRKETEIMGASLMQLLKDPYVLIAAGALTFGNVGIAMLEPSLPLWMISKMSPSKWQLGAAFLPASFSYLVSANIFGTLGNKIGRWLCSMVGLIVIGGGMLLIPFSSAFVHLIAPNTAIGFGIGMVDGTMMPIMAHLVDIRHSAVYGGVYAIADVGLCIGFAIGPSLSGALAQAVGFSWMLRMVAIVGFIYAPFCIFLRNPPAKEENVSILMMEKDAVAHNLKHPSDYQTMDYESEYSD
ncbi:Synaptic vesicular amine transporter [Holothuria leucospilota]|uniref:Synaptic vesicular amine transporter n=1 Tax=Holothuria leucospilota TaxID=206669 RepID=A0A9Q0YQX1_HOLLE|nr:Synaptic vesicular amine transporter [Holothuria leucospilota]